MKTVKEVSKFTGVSIRTLHYYDSIGLLKPTKVTETGYRLYDDTALERLQLILLFRALQFPLKEIREIMDSSGFNRNRALEQQIQLLEMQKEHIENLITFARGIQLIGVKQMDFSAFDTRKIDEYAAQAKAMWGKTAAYQEFEEKSKSQSEEERKAAAKLIMDIFKAIGALRSLPPDSIEIQELVGKLRQFINENFYTCTPEIFKSLGAMYAGGGRITENIEQTGGRGTAELTAKAIDIYCEKLKNE